MIFSYECQKCKKRFDGEFPIGKAPRATACPYCKGVGKRLYEGMSIMLKVNGANGGINRTSGFGELMKSKNAAAADRMKGKKPPMRVKAYDYGNGKVVEAK